MLPTVQYCIQYIIYITSATVQYTVLYTVQYPSTGYVGMLYYHSTARVYLLDTNTLSVPERSAGRPFFAAGGAKTRPAPQLRSAAGGDVLLACPGPNAGRRGRHGGARGRKDENPDFWGTSVRYPQVPIAPLYPVQYAVCSSRNINFFFFFKRE
jgi:hypothetical protein